MTPDKHAPVQVTEEMLEAAYDAHRKYFYPMPEKRMRQCDRDAMHAALQAALSAMPVVQKDNEALTFEDYEEAFRSHRSLVRDIDVIINGEDGAAKQASLCDLVGQIEELVLIRDRATMPPPHPVTSNDALRKLLMAAKILLQNSEGCATNHYGNDIELHGLPGWLSDCKKDIEAGAIAIAAAETSGTVEWRCFHCDEVFTDREEAGEHFGYMEDGASEETAGKLTKDEKGLVGLLRQVWAELRLHQEEDTALHRSLWSLSADAETKRREWGDKEYAKGLADGRAESAPSPQAEAREAVIDRNTPVSSAI